MNRSVRRLALATLLCGTFGVGDADACDGRGRGGFARTVVTQTGFARSFQQPQRFVQPHFSQPVYGPEIQVQPIYGQPMHRQPEFAHSDFPQPDFGQRDFAQPHVDQRDFGQPNFGQPNFGQPNIGQREFGQANFEQRDLGQGQFAPQNIQPSIQRQPTNAPPAGNRSFSSLPNGNASAQPRQFSSTNGAPASPFQNQRPGISQGAPAQSSQGPAQSSQGPAQSSQVADLNALQILEGMNVGGGNVDPQVDPSSQVDDNPLPEFTSVDAANNPAPQPTGLWVAKVGNQAEIQLRLSDDGSFEWSANNKGKASRFRGTYSVDSGSLVLQREDNQQLSGAFQLNGNDSFHFKVASGNANDAGLQFERR